MSARRHSAVPRVARRSGHTNSTNRSRALACGFATLGCRTSTLTFSAKSAMEHSIIVTNAGAMTRSDRATTARQHPGIYWVSTMYIVLTSFAAGVSAILRAPALFAELLRLGYPSHFIVLLGSWEVLGAAALCAPRRPLLKEWAYAGMFINFSGAIVAHASAADGAGSYLAPVLSISALIASWWLRPPSRRVAER